MTSAFAQPVRVLVIDDDPVMREVLHAVLSSEEHLVESAESGEAALVELRGGFAAEVVLTDIQLPGISGSTLAAELRRAAPAARLLGMSGSEPAGKDRAAFDAFLLKPFSTDEFTAALTAAPHPASSAPAVSAEGQSAVCLDEATYDRLAGTLRPAQLGELYLLTLEDADTRLSAMEDARARNDLPAFRREAHALKGGCGMVGALELASLAARAEAGSFGDTPAAEDFTAAAKRLRSIITARSTVPN